MSESQALPLREETSRNQNNESVSVALCSYQLHPVVGLNLLLESKSISDFDVFALYHLVVDISVGVYSGEDIQSLLFLALDDQETWAFRHEEDEADLDETGDKLDHGGNTPRPVVVDTGSAISQPSCRVLVDVILCNVGE